MGRERESPEWSASNAAGWLFLACLGLAPLHFGANIPLAWGLNAAAFGFLLSLLGAERLISGKEFPVGARRLAIPLGVTGLVLVWAVLQTQSWMPAGLHHPAWSRAAAALGAPLAGAISLDPGETWLAVLRLGTAVTVFILAVQLGRDPAWAARIVWASAIFGALYATGAMALRAAGDGAGSWLPASLFQAAQGSALTWPFVNRNHFAIYLVLALAACWALFLRDVHAALQDPGVGGPRAWAARAVGVGSAVLRHAPLFAPLLTGLLLAGSRAGFLLALLAILIMAAVERLPRRRTSRGSGRLALAAVTTAAGLALAAQGSLLSGRFAASQISDIGSRAAVAEITARAILDRPLTGHGYGTFAQVFPLFRDSSLPLSGRWEEAHNAYLEAALGLGLPAALVFAGGAGWVAWRCLRGAMERKRHRVAPGAAVGAAVAASLHACTDFSIQIQGVALACVALLGAGYAQSWSSREK